MTLDAPDIVTPAVMAKVPGWEERSKRMLAEYGAPTPKGSCSDLG